MDESDSTTLTAKEFNYLSLLQQIDKLLNLSTNSNNPHNAIEQPWDISEIEVIFKNLTVSIQGISKQMAFEKSAMFLISILNTIMRVSAIDGFGYIISQERFQSMFKVLQEDSVIATVVNKPDSYPTLAGDMLESMLRNLVKDDFIETCFKRLLSNDTMPSKGNVLCFFIVELSM